MPNIDGSLLIAIIAAGSALLGSVVGQLGPVVQHWLSTRRERKTFLRQRYEHMAHLSAKLSVRLMEQVHAARTSASPEPKQDALEASIEMHTLALLYFPELVLAMRALHQAMGEASQALAAGKNEQAIATADAFAAARSTANTQIQQFASKYT